MESSVKFHHEAPLVSLTVSTDGFVLSPARQGPRVSMHMGRSVFMVSERGGYKHRGLGVHGDLDVVPANTPCRWEPDSPDTALTLCLKPELLTRTAAQAGLVLHKTELINRFQVRDDQLEHLCLALYAEMKAGNPTGPLFGDSLATAVAALLLKRHNAHSCHTSSAGRAVMTGNRLRRTLSFIEDNLSRGITLFEIAEAAGLSISHLKTTFRDALGLPVHQYVIQRRVQRAADLLRQGRLTVDEAAKRAGFSHKSHLAKHMQRFLHCLPKDVLESSAPLGSVRD